MAILKGRGRKSPALGGSSSPDDIPDEVVNFERERMRIAEENRRNAATILKSFDLGTDLQRSASIFSRILTEEEMTGWRQHPAYIRITSQDGKPMLVMTANGFGVHYNIFNTDDHDCRLYCYCGAPLYQHGDSYADVWAGQIVALKTDKTRFLKVAYGGYSHTTGCTGEAQEWQKPTREAPFGRRHDGYAYMSCYCCRTRCVDTYNRVTPPHEN